MRRFAGERMERVERTLRAMGETNPQAITTARQVLDGVTAAYQTAVKNRATHPSSHRLLAYAHLKAGRLQDAFRAITVARNMQFEGRFLNVQQILTEDQAILASAWKHACPNTDVEARMNAIFTEYKINANADTVLSHPHATTPTLRFVLNWETDANDVDFHIYDSNNGHAYYGQREGAPPGVLYGDLVQGWGPECFTIPQKANAFPYRMEAHYYSAGPMGFGMGKLEIIDSKGDGRVFVSERAFVVQQNQAFVKLGSLSGFLDDVPGASAFNPDEVVCE